MNITQQNKLSLPLTEELLLPSKKIALLDSEMHYLDVGTGEPIVFIHGIPTWSYTWRNIIPVLADDARCIAPDLIGFGRSGKPDIEYTTQDHIRYLEAFFEKLELKNITLVLHGYGTILGLAFARLHPDKVKAIAVFEGYLKPIRDWHKIPLPVQELYKVFRSLDHGQDAVFNKNFFVENVLSAGTVRRLTETEKKYYQEPFPTKESRKPLWTFVQEAPIPGGKEESFELLEKNSAWLCQSPVPKLLIYAIPGFISSIEEIQWAKNHLSNLTMVDIEGHHYLPEGNPLALREALCLWYESQVLTRIR